MSIYLSGDTHGTYDVGKIQKLTNIVTENDYVIVLGDFGICWDDNGSDTKTRNFWNRHKCKTLFIDGNHENFDLLGHYRVREWNGGKIHDVGKKISHLMRGQIFEIEGKTFFTFGGAASHDCGSPLETILCKHLDKFHSFDFREEFERLMKYERRMCRVPGRSWWAAEVPTTDEIAEAKANLAAHGNKVDYILTHTPSSRVYRHFGFEPKGQPWQSDLIDLFDWIEENIEFRHWYFGHLHEDFSYDAKHSGLYDTVRELR